MARYQLQSSGVLDKDTGDLIMRAGMPKAWGAYQKWLAAGNIPDPYVPPAPPQETLEQAKARRIDELQKAGVALARTRFQAVQDFETLRMLSALVLKIVPAARAAKDDIDYIADLWTVGDAALKAVRAATSVAAVNAVNAKWPAP